MVVIKIGGFMKKIQILGTGCAKCKQLTANAEAAIQGLGIDAAVEKVSDIKEIMAFGVMSTPAIAVDGKVLSSGKVLSPEEIKKLIG
jgi:small redox-active disulfide protein 2